MKTKIPLLLSLIFILAILPSVNAIVWGANNITLNSPANNSIQYTNLITFNSTANITGSGQTLINMSLFNSINGGEWTLKNTTQISLGGYAYYNLDEVSGTTAYDSLGSNHGTITTTTLGQAGKINNSYLFNGATSKINKPSFWGMPINATYSMWLWTNDTAGGILNMYAGDSTWDQIIITGTGNITFEYGTVGGSSTYWTTKQTLPQNQWVHLVVTINNQSGKIYFNGTEMTTTYGTNGLNRTRPAGTASLNIDAGYSLTPNYAGYIDEVGIWDRVLSSSEVTLLYNSGNGRRNIEPVSTQTFTNTYSSGDNVIWNVQACASDGTCGFAPANYTFTIDSTPPTIAVNYPTALLNYGRVNGTLQLNWTATDINLDKCWYNYDGTNITLGTCTSGVANLNNITLSTKKNITFYANDTAGNLNTTFWSWDYKVFENSRTHNLSSYETAYESYLINVTANSSLTGINLLFNGTSLSMDNQGSGIWSYSRDLPTSVVGNNSIQYQFTYAGSNFNSDTTYQNVLNTIFILCNGTYTTRYLNLTFKDENTFASINATIPTSSFVYWLGTGTQTKTYTYINTTANPIYSFCVSPTNRPLNVDANVQYAGSNYPQRVWNPLSQVFTNSTTSQALYLLLSSDGVYQEFILLSPSGQIIQGVEVLGYRIIEGQTVYVAQGTTDGAGSATFWINPDFTHYFTFTKLGYDVFELTLQPTGATRTIVLSGGDTGTQITDYSKGIKFNTYPSGDFLLKDTKYYFNFSITSTYWTLDEFGFTLKYQNGSVIGTQSSTDDTGGTLYILANTTNQTKIIMNYYYTVNNTQINGTRYWLTQKQNDFSIWHFFTDLATYIDQDIFGIKGDDDGQFSKALISVLIIVLGCGLLIMRYGLVNDAAILGMITGILLFLNTLNLLPNLSIFENSVISFGDFLVYITLIITIGFIIKEEKA